MGKKSRLLKLLLRLKETREKELYLGPKKKRKGINPLLTFQSLSEGRRAEHLLRIKGGNFSFVLTT